MINTEKSNFIKFCFITRWYYPIESGAEKTVREFSEHLINKKHRVDIVTTRKDKTMRKTEIKDGYKIIRIDKVRLIPRLFGLLKIMNIIFQDIIFIYHMIRLQQNNNYDILLCSTNETIHIGAVFVKYFFRIPIILIWTDSNLDVLDSVSWKDLNINRKIYLTYKRIITKWIIRNMSQIFLKVGVIKNDFIKKFKIEQERVTLIGNPINVPKNNSVSNIEIPGIDKSALKDKFIILFANRIKYIKGIDLLPGIVRKVQELTSDFVLIICGKGKFPSKLYKELKSNEIKKNILMLGEMNWKNLKNVIKLSDLSLITSRHETALGKTILESMALEKPVIVRKTKGWPDSIKHLKQIYFVDDLTHNDFSNAILHLKENKTLRIKIGRNARKEVLNNWNLDTFTNQFIDICKGHIARS